MDSKLTKMQGFFCDMIEYGNNKLIAIENGMLIFEVMVGGYERYFNIPLRDAVNYMNTEEMMKKFQKAQKTEIIWRKHAQLDEIWQFLGQNTNYWG